MAAHPKQNSKDVAKAVVRIIDTPAGERPVRTVVDGMGMGAALAPYNQQLDGIMEGILSNLGAGGRLKLNKNGDS